MRENTARFTRVIEDYVRAHPDQWLWVHKRWKTRPPGEKPIYPFLGPSLAGRAGVPRVSIRAFEPGWVSGRRPEILSGLANLRREVDMTHTAGELAQYLERELEGDALAPVSGVASPDRARAEDLIYVDSPRHHERAAEIRRARCAARSARRAPGGKDDHRNG